MVAKRKRLTSIFCFLLLISKIDHNKNTGGKMDEILQEMSLDELRALNDYDDIAESFLSNNFSYRDTTATDSLIADIKAQNLALARFVPAAQRRMFA